MGHAGKLRVSNADVQLSEGAQHSDIHRLVVLTGDQLGEKTSL